MRVAFVRLGERPLVVGLQAVVEFHLGAFDQLVDHAPHIGARRELPEDADQALYGLEVGAQRLVSARVLDLDGHLAAVGPHRFVDLADAGRGHRGVVERQEPLAPPGAELAVEHAVHPCGGQRRGILLQLRQSFAVGLAELLGDGGFHHRQRLADLHRPALEFTEHREQLVCRLLHKLGVDLVLGLAGQAFAEAQRGAAGHPDGKARELCVARDAAASYLCHLSIIHDSGRRELN